MVLLVTPLLSQSQFLFHLGYNVSSAYNWQKGKSFVEYEFNETQLTELQKPLKMNDLFSGIIIGFGGNEENWVFEMLKKRRVDVFLDVKKITPYDLCIRH